MQCLELPITPLQPINKKIIHFSALEPTFSYTDNNIYINKAKAELRNINVCYFITYILSEI